MSDFMRLLVFFDIPVKTAEERKSATAFRKWLLNDGYYMIQYSVYGRLCNTLENAQDHERRLKPHIPQEGSVRSMIVTEKQYSTMSILCGIRHKKEKPMKENQISFF